MTRFLATAAVLLLSHTASAQRFAVAPVDLGREGTIADPQLDCAFAIDQVVGWFDRGTQAIYVGGRDLLGPFSNVILDAEALDAAAEVDVVRCQAVYFDLDTNTPYFIFATEDDVEFVLALRFDDDDNLVPDLIASAASGAADGATGIVLRGGRLFVSVQAAKSATLEDGIYSFAPRGAGQTATPVVLDPDLSLVGLTATTTEFGPQTAFSLFSVSDRMGAGAYRNKLVEVRTPTLPGAALRVAADPFDGTAFTVPADPSMADLSSVVAAVSRQLFGGGGVDYYGAVFVLSRDAGASGDEIVRYEFTRPAALFATGAGIATSLGRTGFAAGAGVSALMADEVGYRLYLVNSGPQGGRDEILVTSGNFATPAEAPATASADVRVSASPNPFRDRLSVAVENVPEGEASIRIYDALGREVAILHDGTVTGGRLDVSMNARSLAAGVYAVRVRTVTGSTTSRVVLAR